jgi:glycosyltransferase involved in cell wall biosynthesis
VVVSVGHIRRSKGYDVMLRAAADVCKVAPETVFLVAGDNHEPEHFAELKTLAGTLGLNSNLRFLGPVEDIRSLLQAADLYCLPSRSEGLSNALLEAMACELPCVATRVGGNPEVMMEGKTGYLVENEDAPSMAAAILRVLQQLPAGRRMGAEGRRLVEENFTTRAMMKMLVDSYERLLLTRS